MKHEEQFQSSLGKAESLMARLLKDDPTLTGAEVLDAMRMALDDDEFTVWMKRTSAWMVEQEAARTLAGSAVGKAMRP